MTPNITKEIVKEYIDDPSKEINLKKSFLSTLSREIGTVLY